MKPKFLAALATAAAILIVPATGAWAQPAENCLEYKAVVQLAYDQKTGLYLGPIYATLGDEVLAGKYLPTSTPPSTTCDGIWCQDIGSRYVLDFGNGNILTVDLHIGVYPEAFGFGTYYSVEKVVGGTGIFEKATGTLFEKGPFVAWMDDAGRVISQYAGEIGGSICGIAKTRTQASQSPKTTASRPASPVSPGKPKVGSTR